MFSICLIVSFETRPGIFYKHTGGAYRFVYCFRPSELNPRRGQVHQTVLVIWRSLWNLTTEQRRTDLQSSARSAVAAVREILVSPFAGEHKLVWKVIFEITVSAPQTRRLAICPLPEIRLIIGTLLFSEESITLLQLE